MAGIVAPTWLPLELPEDIESWLTDRGEVFARFETQDSGNRAYGVCVEGQRWFFKIAAPEHAHMLPGVQRLHAAVAHDALIPILAVVPAPETQVGVYPWVPGEVLYPADGALAQRFHQRPVKEVLAALARIFDVHWLLARAGYVSVDLYDECFLYDFDACAMRLCDLDEYRRGPFVNEVGRLPGSTRFMAPEEFQRGATIDERTLVFHLGRTAQVLLRDGEGLWRGSSGCGDAAARATRPRPQDRSPTVQAFLAEWQTYA